MGFFGNMLAEITSKNEITLPEAVASRFADVECFNVSTDGECIVLRLLRESRVNEVRAKLAELGVDKQDVAAAVDWARKSA